MSGLIFPASLLGIKLTPKKSPYTNTVVQKALTGKTSRLALQPYPLYKWELAYQFLSDQFAQMPPRTNFIPYSQDFTQWSAFSSGSAIAPVVVGDWTGTQAPDGTYTADRVILNQVTAGGGGTDFTADSSTITADSSDTADSGPGSGNASQIQTASANTLALGQQYAFSVWLRTNDGSTVSVYLFYTPEVTSPGSGYQLVTVTPSWQRFTAVGTVTAKSASANLVGIGLTGSASVYADLSCWGAQLETGAYASAYIMTNGAAIRVSDLKTMFGLFSQVLGQWDTFLYQDPDFNTVTHQQFAVGNGSTLAFNLTANNQPGAEIDQWALDADGDTPVIGPAGTPDYVQNTIGAPCIYTARYGAPELLSSDSRTNIALQSNFQAQGSPYWVVAGTGAALALNSLESPDGSTAAAKFTEGTSSATAYAVSEGRSGVLTPNSRNTFSIWLKAGTRQYVNVTLQDGSGNGACAVFDLGNGVASGVLVNGTAYASDADVGMVAFPDGWYRCSISCQYASSAADMIVYAASSFTVSWSPTITGAGDYFYLWGAQLEAGTQPTALIPTTSENASNGGSDYSLTSSSTSGTQVITFYQVQFTTAPALDVPLLWSGSFWYRCRFSEDTIEFGKQANRLWQLGKLALEQVVI